jgi:hypothetical protein
MMLRGSEPILKYLREFFTQHKRCSLENHKFVIDEVLHIPANCPDENSKVDVVGFHVFEYRNDILHKKSRIGEKLKQVESALLVLT